MHLSVRRCRSRHGRTQRTQRRRSAVGTPLRDTEGTTLGRGALRRLMALLLTLVLLGAAAIAVITATSGQSDAVRLRRVVYDDVQRSVDAMKQLVEENTR